MMENKTKLNAMEKILNTKSKRTRETEANAGGVLARLWRIILHDVNITSPYWKSLVDQKVKHTKRTLEKTKDTDKDTSTTSGSLNKEFGAPSMTIKTFLKGLKLLGILKIKIEISAYWPNKTITKHDLIVQLYPQSKIDNEYRKYEQRHLKNKDVIEEDNSEDNDDTVF
jgi:hypothetical protein